MRNRIASVRQNFSITGLPLSTKRGFKGRAARLALPVAKRLALLLEQQQPRAITGIVGRKK